MRTQKDFFMTSRDEQQTEGPKEKQTQKAVLRNWHMLNILATREQGVTVQELAVECGTTSRTIQRDLKDLASIGFSFETRNVSRGLKYWRLKSGTIPTLRLTWAEAAALYVGRKLMEPLAGTYLFVSAQDAYKKLAHGFDKQVLKYLDKLAQTFHPTRFGSGDYSDYGQTIDTLMITIEERKRLSLEYQSQDVTEPVTREVYPLALVYHKFTLYLIAWAEARGEPRNYKVDRITAAEYEPGSLPFNPIEFDLEKYLEGSFGIYQGKGPPIAVKIRFKPQVVRYVEEKRWHTSEKLTRQPDGTLIAEFRLTSFEEVKNWVLSFGPQAELLEPQSLREEISATIQAMSQIYSKPTDSSTKAEPKRSLL
jgi:predicted DNA-binding transcriptional regulator YafY